MWVPSTPRFVNKSPGLVSTTQLTKNVIKAFSPELIEGKADYDTI